MSIEVWPNEVKYAVRNKVEQLIKNEFNGSDDKWMEGWWMGGEGVRVDHNVPLAYTTTSYKLFETPGAHDKTVDLRLNSMDSLLINISLTMEQSRNGQVN